MLAAILFAVVLIGGSALLADGGAQAPVAEASQESDLLAALAKRDSTGDGLPDWEKALYGIPLTATTTDYFHLGMTDGEAVKQGLIVPKALSDVAAATSTGAVIDPDLPPAPAEGTLTAAFSAQLLTLYLDRVKQTGGSLTDADLADITNQALAGLKSSIALAPDFKQPGDLAVEGSGAAAMTAFAAAAERVLDANTTTATTSELDYLQAAVNANDPAALAALAALASIAKAYRGSAAGLAQVPVPQELAADDLNLVNALARVSEIVNDFARVNSDPLAAMLALDQYPAAVLTLADAFTGVARDYQAAGVTLAPGTPGASFVSVMSDVAANEQQAQKP